MENLGKRARDKVTGFEGIIIGKCSYLYGCDQYGIVPEAKDGKILDAYWFDKGRVEITGNGITAEEVKTDKPGGLNADAPRGRY